MDELNLTKIAMEATLAANKINGKNKKLNEAAITNNSQSNKQNTEKIQSKQLVKAATVPNAIAEENHLKEQLNKNVQSSQNDGEQSIPHEETSETLKEANKDSSLIVDGQQIEKQSLASEVILSTKVIEFYEVGNLVYVTPFEYLLSALVFIMEQQLDEFDITQPKIRITVDDEKCLSIETIKSRLTSAQRTILDIIITQVDILVNLDENRLTEVDDSILDRRQVADNTQKELAALRQDLNLQTAKEESVEKKNDKTISPADSEETDNMEDDYNETSMA